MHTQCRYEVVIFEDTLACYTVLDFLLASVRIGAEV